jgi:hypothetical protein
MSLAATRLRGFRSGGSQKDEDDVLGRNWADAFG